MLTIRANDPRRSSGRARRMVRTALSTPMSKVACHWSSSSCSNGPIPTSTGPAAFTRTSSPSHRWPRRSSAALTSVRLVRSANKGRLSALPADRKAVIVSSSASPERASTATRAPSRAKASAAARPIPREPPATRTRASASPRSISYLLFAILPAQRRHHCRGADETALLDAVARPQTRIYNIQSQFRGYQQRSPVLCIFSRLVSSLRPDPRFGRGAD
jgi:hypothetical protein